jgi:rod shape-determining protein MreD
LPETAQTIAPISCDPAGTVYFFLFITVATTAFFNKELSAQLHPSFWLPVFTGTACWPLVYTVLRFIRKSRLFR